MNLARKKGIGKPEDIKKNGWRKKSAEKLYIGGLLGFAFIFLFIFLSPVLFGRNYNYADAEIHDYHTYGNNIKIAVVRKEYNKEKRMMRVDFMMEENSSMSTTLANMVFDMNVNFVSKRGAVETNLQKINDNFYVAMIENIPKDFEVMSILMTADYIHPEIQNDDLDGKSVKFYVNETEDILNDSLKAGSFEEYENDYIDIKQEEIADEIERCKEEIVTCELTIETSEKRIEDISDELVYMTEAEIKNAESQIRSYESTIESKHSSIETLKEEIVLYKEKINLLEQKRNKFMAI